MKMRSTQEGREFDAELTTEHPASVPGPVAVRRLDTGEYISLGDIFYVPSRQFDLLEVSDEERTRLEAAGLMIVPQDVLEEAVMSAMDIQDLIPKVVQSYQDYGHIRPTLYAQVHTSASAQAYLLLNFVGDGRMKSHQLFVEGRQAGQHHLEQELLETTLVSEATFTSPDSQQKIEGVLFATAANHEPFQSVIRAYAIKREKGKARELKLLSENIDPEGLMGLAFICGWRSRGLSDAEVSQLQPRGMRAFLK